MTRSMHSKAGGMKLTSALAFTAILVLGTLAYGMAPELIPPTQGSGELPTTLLSDLRILAVSQGAALVTFRVSSFVNPGVFRIGMIEADSGMLPSSLLITPLSDGFSVESVSIVYSGGLPFSISWSALSENGGECAFQVTYLTYSISWNTSGQLSTSKSMLADGRFYLGIRNTSSIRYHGAEIILVGKGGAVQSQKDSLYGLDIWKEIKQAGQAIDLEPDSELKLIAAELESAPYRTYIGGAIGSSLKGYTGKAIVKESIRMDIILEVATTQEMEALPSKTMSLAIYHKDSENSITAANNPNVSDVTLGNGLLSVRLGQSADITAEIERTESRSVGTSSYEESFRIIVRSNSATATEVQLTESFPGEWAMISYTGAEWLRMDGNMAVAKFTLPAKGTVTQMYKVRYTYTK